MKKYSESQRRKRIREIRKLLETTNLPARERSKLASALGGLMGAGTIGRKLASIKANRSRWNKTKKQPRRPKTK